MNANVIVTRCQRSLKNCGRVWTEKTGKNKQKKKTAGKKRL